MRYLMAIAALLLAACAQPSNPGAARAALMEAAEAYERAQIAGDGDALQQLMADDYVLVGSDGARQNKAELIAFWTAEGFDPEPVTVTDPVEHVWADGAALGGRVTLQGLSGGEPFSVDIRYVDLWALRDGEWRVVYGQSTRAPAS